MNPRALMIANPNASGTTPRVRDVIAHALGSALKVDVAETTHRHHATELAMNAVRDGYGTVISLGGDGTLNEVVNGIAGSPVMLIALPGGHTNVFARTFGLPRDPVEATSVVLANLEGGTSPRAMDIGRVNGRAFAFNAGLGFDADVVRAVEARPRAKRRWGEIYFVVAGVRRFFAGYPRRPSPMTVDAGERIEGVKQIFVCASDPYTYFRTRPFRLCPDARQGAGLSATAVTSLSTVTALRTLGRAFGRARHGRLRAVHILDGLDAFTVTATQPVPLQVDGDYAGEATAFAFTLEREALQVLIPPPSAAAADRR